jgi:hypothetical protein
MAPVQVDVIKIKSHGIESHSMASSFIIGENISPQYKDKITSTKNT